MIGRAGVGVDNVDVAAATRRGIVVANAPEATVVSAAEHTIALLLALARNIPQAHGSLAAGKWERSRFTGIELTGKTLGVLGLGRIGWQVARRALALGLRVVAYDPFVSLDRFRELGVEAATTPEDVYAEADLITLHLPLNEQTSGLVGRDAFAQMRDGVRIVNAARGGLVDEAALEEAIRSGKVAGAALDVFESEPYSGPLLELEQVVATPHLAGSTDEAQDRAGVIIAEQVAAALEGELVQTAVNIPVVDQEDLEVLGPFIPLAAKLGRLATALSAGRPARVVVAAHGPLSGYDTRLLTVAALNGAFQDHADQTVNYVNAPVIAAERGIEVSEQRFAGSQHYTNLVRVVVSTDREEVEVSGTTMGPEHRLFLAGALGFAIDIELAPRIAFLVYDDLPGVIGRVGTMFGEAGVNIANMAVSRTKEGGKALMAFSIDSAPPPDLVERVAASGFDDARFITLALDRPTPLRRAVDESSRNRQLHRVGASCSFGSHSRTSASSGDATGAQSTRFQRSDACVRTLAGHVANRPAIDFRRGLRPGRSPSSGCPRSSARPARRPASRSSRRDPDGRGRRGCGRLRPRPDREVPRPRVRRPSRRRPRPGRPARRPKEDRARRRNGERPHREGRRGDAGDRLRAGGGRAVPAPGDRDRPHGAHAAPAPARLGRRRLAEAHGRPRPRRAPPPGARTDFGRRHRLRFHRPHRPRPDGTQGELTRCKRPRRSG